MAKGDETQDIIRNWIICGVSILGLISAFIAARGYVSSIKKYRAEQDIGFICCNQRRMGYFQSKVPSYMWPNSQATVLSVPTMTGLLRAGEGNVFTSALVDELSDNLSDDVCWKQIYENFFRQLAWDGHSDPRVATIMRNASSDVWKKMRLSSGDMHTFDVEAQSCCRRILRQYFRWERRRYTLGEQYTPYNRYHDRRLMYRIISGHSPPLVRCVIPLRQIGAASPFSPLTGDHSIWQRNLRPIWIYDGHPCIPVPMQQLAGFCLVFGINLHQDNHTLSGAGAFGLRITISPHNEFNRIHLTQARRPSKQQPAKGNGYSVLFAKLLACGCLPFAQTSSWTKSIKLNLPVLEGIRMGRCILDVADPMPETTSKSYLAALPGQTNDDFFYSCTAITEYGHFGSILDRNGNDLGVPGDFTWAKAVAGIAFGGFVPQTTRILAEAVRLTAQGVDVINSRHSLMNEVEIFINTVHSWDPQLELFGPFISRRLDAQIDPVNASYILPCDIPTAAAIFGRYMTLIERLAAIVLEQARTSGSEIQNQIYVKLCNMLQNSYEAAVERSYPNVIPHGIKAECRNVEDLVDGLRVIREKNKVTITDTDCAYVARILIVVWTYQVNLIQWPYEAQPPNGFETEAQPAVTLLPPEDQLGALGLCE